LWLEAWARYSLGEYARSRECLDESYMVAKSVDRADSWLVCVGEIGRGLSDLGEGRVDSARARLDSIDAALDRVPAEDPAYVELAEYGVAMYRAELLLAEGSTDRCIEACRSLPLPGIPGMASASMFYYNYPCDRDILARGYVEKGAIDEAIAEYERLVTFDPESRDRRLIFPLFHYRLGVLYEERGETGKASREYERLLEICGEVAPEITEVADARRRLAALSQSAE
jgi:tetratricopeptide (TPR) repeat protein